jgi:hypothetical protein
LNRPGLRLSTEVEIVPYVIDGHEATCCAFAQLRSPLRRVTINAGA